LIFVYLFRSFSNCFITLSWQIKPNRGVIKTNDHQIIIIKMIPDIDSYIVDKCEFKLNYTEKHFLAIGLICSSLKPNVKFNNNGIIYFNPTCQNNSTYKECKIENLTSNKLCYEWHVPFEIRELVSTEKMSSFLMPYEKKVI
jgi:hypothetical protein